MTNVHHFQYGKTILFQVFVHLPVHQSSVSDDSCCESHYGKQIGVNSKYFGHMFLHSTGTLVKDD